MPTISAAELERLRQAAKLTETIRGAISRGATPTLTRPKQTIKMMLDTVAQVDREPLQVAWAQAVTGVGGPNG